jgi:WD40 repeat protein
MHDGNKLEICGFYHPGRRFEGVQGKERPNPYKNKTADIADIFISSDNKKIASINRNGEITIWDKSSGEKITHWFHTKGDYHTSDEYLQQQLTHLIRAPKKHLLENVYCINVRIKVWQYLRM